MSLKTLPVIYYVDPINKDNNLLNFREPNQPPALEITAGLLVGSYTLTDLATEVQRALNDNGQETYTVTIDRDTRICTIAASDTFELLVSTGSNIGLGPYSLLGFTGSDRTGSNSYSGDLPVGTEYIPQFLVQDFVDFADNLEGTQASVNESAEGIVEVVTFGDRRFTEFNITYITNRERDKDGPIRNNPQGIEEARSLMEFLIKKSEVELMYDRADRSDFTKVLLESTRQDRTGTAYQLRELINRGLEGYFETGRLRFRKVNS